MNGHMYFEIHADDPDRASTFYHSVFGWKITEAQEEISIEYRRITTGGMAGGMLKRPVKTPPPDSGANAFVCSVEVDNFDETAEKILAAGGKVAVPKFAIPYVCWQGYFTDTEGNNFGLFQVDPEAR
jgi:uncharacterized protein